MWYAKITYRQRGPTGQDVPIHQCQTTINGPFTTREGAEKFAISVANTTSVFRMVIEEVCVP